MPLIFVPFASSGAFTDRRTAKVIVGNALNGDAAADCDFLDPGDGTGIAAAIAALPADGDLFLRAGIYDLGLAAAPPGVFLIPAGARVWAAGSGPAGTEIIMPDDSGNQRAFQLGAGAELHDVRVTCPPPTVATAAGGVVEYGVGCRVADVVVDMQGFNYVGGTVALQAVVDAFLGGTGAGAAGSMVTRCEVVNGPSFFNLVGPGATFAGFGFYDIVPGVFVTLLDCKATSADIGVRVDGNAQQDPGQFERAQIIGFQGINLTVTGILFENVSDQTVIGGGVTLRQAAQATATGVLCLTDADGDFDNIIIQNVRCTLTTGGPPPSGIGIWLRVVGNGSWEKCVISGCIVNLAFDTGYQLDLGTTKNVVNGNVTGTGLTFSVVDNGALNDVAHNVF